MQHAQLDRRAREALLADLESMPDYLENAFADLQAPDLKRSGSNGGFSPIEHVWHLADLERDGFAERIARLRTETRPELPDFDGDLAARRGDYKSRSLKEGIAQFRATRKANISSLRGLADEDWLRPGVQEGVGSISMCDMPAMMAAHDASHRSEIEAWLGATHARSPKNA